MPNLIVNGKYTPKDGPCEWCGQKLRKNEQRYVSTPYFDKKPEGVKQLSIVTRLCQDCVSIHNKIWSYHV